MRKKRTLTVLLTMGVLLAALFLLLPRSPDPDLRSNKYASADLSRLGEGVVRVRYTGGGEMRLKVRITREEGTDYHYDLSNDGAWETFLLTEGEGTYTLEVLENQRENIYKSVFSCTLPLALSDPLAPFRQSSRTVPFAEDSPVATQAAALMEGLTEDSDKIDAVFSYVVETLTYDAEKAAAAQPGYLPDLDQVLREGKGFCLDYATLLTAMLRSQDIPCRLAVGYAGQEYHAWVELPLSTGGWKPIDPTFLSANPGDKQVETFVNTPGNYRAKYYY